MRCVCTSRFVPPMQVAEAAVIAVPDKKWTERPLLVCVKAEGEKCTKDDMLNFLKPRMSKWWLPGELLQLCHRHLLQPVRTPHLLVPLTPEHLPILSSSAAEKVVFVKEIPHTATGKISKLQLRKQYQTADGKSKL